VLAALLQLLMLLVLACWAGLVFLERLRGFLLLLQRLKAPLVLLIGSDGVAVVETVVLDGRSSQRPLQEIDGRGRRDVSENENIIWSRCGLCLVLCSNPKPNSVQRFTYFLCQKLIIFEGQRGHCKKPSFWVVRRKGWME
jgi:hypothetical protein